MYLLSKETGGRCDVPCACITMSLNAGARVVTKAYPQEKVGVFAQRGEAVEVVEYSELDPQEAAFTDPGKASCSGSRIKSVLSQQSCS